MTKTWCVGGRQTMNQNVYEKLNPATRKLVKINKGECSICRRSKKQIFTSSK